MCHIPYISNVYGTAQPGDMAAAAHSLLTIFALQNHAAHVFERKLTDPLTGALQYSPPSKPEVPHRHNLPSYTDSCS
jgi:hypothetical protein